MAEAPNIIYLSILLSAGIIYYLFKWTFSSPVLHKSLIRPASLRKQLRLQHRYRPKYQYRYHWFKQLMKRKKTRKFRKLQPLFHLTWQYKAMMPTWRLLLAILRVGCCTERWLDRLVSPITIKCWIQWLTCRYRLHETQIVAYQYVYHNTAHNKAKFDTDSFTIVVDTLCSITMSGNVTCFENLKRMTSGSVGVIAGGLSIQGIGTFCFKQEDSTGQVHAIKLHNSLYVPNLPTTLLCPQHWSRQDDVDGTYIKTSKDGFRLVWNRGRCKKFVPLYTNTNTPTFFTAPGSFNYQAFKATYLAAYNASRIRPPTVSINPNQLRGERPLDPIEFLVTEELNLPEPGGEMKRLALTTQRFNTAISVIWTWSPMLLALYIQQAITRGGNVSTIKPINPHKLVPLPFCQSNSETNLK
jgi:hypothetical protein